MNDNILRPKRLTEYVGQAKAASRLDLAIRATKMRGENLGHVILSGPPGLGKTTLAAIIAAEMGAKFTAYTGPAIEKIEDAVQIMSEVKAGDVLFVDEIHALPRAVEEFFYTVMEDFQMTYRAGEWIGVVTEPVQPFTLIGATTRPGAVSRPLRDRFGIVQVLEYYPQDELATIATRSAAVLGARIEAAAADTLARCGRGTPRIVNRLLARARDFALVEGDGLITEELAALALQFEEIDAIGLTAQDREVLRVMHETYEDKPVGLNALAATLNDDAATIADVVEPYLLKIGFIARTARGRALTSAGIEYLG